MPSDMSVILQMGFYLGFGLLLLSVLCALLWIARVEDGLSRVVGLELLAGLSAAIFVALGVYYSSVFYLEVALLLALIGFIATIGLARLGAEKESDV